MRVFLLCLFESQRANPIANMEEGPVGFEFVLVPQQAESGSPTLLQVVVIHPCSSEGDCVSRDCGYHEYA